MLCCLTGTRIGAQGGSDHGAWERKCLAPDDRMFKSGSNRAASFEVKAPRLHVEADKHVRITYEEFFGA